MKPDDNGTENWDLAVEEMEDQNTRFDGFQQAREKAKEQFEIDITQAEKRYHQSVVAAEKKFRVRVSGGMIELVDAKGEE